MAFLHTAVALTTLISLTNALAQCYLRNGSLAPAAYAPCSTSATGQAGSHTQCCDWENGDICLSSGLCLYPRGGVVGMLNADGCTDPTLADASCQPFCAGVSSGALGYLRVVPCQDGTWCCTTTQDASCCGGDADERFSLDGLGSVINVTATAAATVLTETKTVGVCTTGPSTSASQVKANSTTSTSASSSESGKAPEVTTSDGRLVGAVAGSVLLGGFFVVLFGAML